MNEFAAGTKATVVIPPEDAFGNNVSLASQVQSTFNFTVSATYVNGSVATVLNVTDIGWHENGHLRIEFIVASAGDLLLFVKEKNQSLNGSPLPFKVNPGALLRNLYDMCCKSSISYAVLVCPTNPWNSLFSQ